MGSPSIVRDSPYGGSQDDSVNKHITSYARQDNPRYRTMQCKHDLRGTCPFGQECSFIHTSQPMLVVPPPLPTYHPFIGRMVIPPMFHNAVPHSPPYVYGEALRMDAFERPIPSAPPTTPTLTADAADTFIASSPTDASRRRSKGRQSGRACHYRTKPCRFFHETGRCAKGDRCNFIHDHTFMPVAVETETESSSSLQDSASESDLHSPDARQQQHHSSNFDESRKAIVASPERSNYYPIKWRVIGGGVMMSGSRELCQDYMAGRCSEGVECKLLHPSMGENEEPLEISEHPSPPYYMTGLSPVAPLQLLPVFVQPAPRHRARRGSTRSQNRNATRIQRNEECIVDGHTLLPLKQSEDDNAEVQPLESTPPPEQQATFLAARSIVRPLSAPPSRSTTFTHIARLFPAESP